MAVFRTVCLQVEFVLEEVSALKARLTDIAQKSYDAVGQIVFGALKSVASREPSELLAGLRAAASAGHAYFKQLKGTERLQHIALVSAPDLSALVTMQPVLRQHRGNWIIEVASAGVSCGYIYSEYTHLHLTLRIHGGTYSMGCALVRPRIVP